MGLGGLELLEIEQAVFHGCEVSCPVPLAFQLALHERGLARILEAPVGDPAEVPELQERESGDDRDERPRQDPERLHSPNSLSPGAKVQVRVMTRMSTRMKRMRKKKLQREKDKKNERDA